MGSFAAKPKLLKLLGSEKKRETSIEMVDMGAELAATEKSVEYENLCFTEWDADSHSHANGVIFVVDNDAIHDSSGNSVREKLRQVLADDESLGTPLLVFVNKRELPDGDLVSEVTKRLALKKPRVRKWLVHQCTAAPGVGHGIDWLSAQLKH